MTLAGLARFGWSEAELREHSLEWLAEVTKELSRQRRMDLANDLTLMGLASVLGQGGEEAHDQFTETLEELRSAPDEPGYRTDPHAKPDLEGLAASGLPIQRVASQDANTQQGEQP